MNRQDKIPFLSRDLYWTEPDEQEQEEIIADCVCTEWGITKDELLSKCRKKEFAVPRQVTAFLIYKRTGHNMKRTALVLGYETHGSVLHSVRVIQRKLLGDSEFCGRLVRLQNNILAEELSEGIPPRSVRDCYFVLTALYNEEAVLSDSTLKKIVPILKAMNFLGKPDLDISDHPIYQQLLKKIMT